MTLNITSAGTPRQGRTKHLLVEVAAGVVALATLAGAAAWQARTGDDAKSVETVAPGTANATAAQPAGARTEDPARTVYLVASQAQADALWAAIGEADRYRFWLGEAVPETQVLVVASAEDEVVLQQLAELDAIRGELGLPPTRFIDLRTSSTPTGSAAPCADGGAGDPTLVRFTCP